MSTACSSDSSWGNESCDAVFGREEEYARLQSAITAQFALRLASTAAPRPTRRRLRLREGAPPAVVPVAAVTGEKRGRQTLRDLFREALSVHSAADAFTIEQVDTVVGGITAALKALPEDSAETAHSLVVNLSDPLNTELRERVLTGRISPAALVAMGEEELVNPVLRAKIERRRRQRLEQKTVDFVDRMNSTVTHMYRCPSCGGTECSALFRAAPVVKWHGDDPTPTLLHCLKCSHSFRA